MIFIFCWPIFRTKRKRPGDDANQSAAAPQPTAQPQQQSVQTSKKAPPPLPQSSSQAGDSSLHSQKKVVVGGGSGTKTADHPIELDDGEDAYDPATAGQDLIQGNEIIFPWIRLKSKP